MGWSCRAEAAETMERWSAACVAASGMSNVYQDNDRWYMWEASRVEHEDGAITGSILRFMDDPRGKDSTPAKVVSSFKINPDGTIARSPAWFKRLR